MNEYPQYRNVPVRCTHCKRHGDDVIRTKNMNKYIDESGMVYAEISPMPCEQCQEDARKADSYFVLEMANTGTPTTAVLYMSEGELYSILGLHRLSDEQKEGLEKTRLIGLRQDVFWLVQMNVETMQKLEPATKRIQ